MSRVTKYSRPKSRHIVPNFERDVYKKHNISEHDQAELTMLEVSTSYEYDISVSSSIMIRSCALLIHLLQWYYDTGCPRGLVGTTYAY